MSDPQSTFYDFFFPFLSLLTFHICFILDHVQMSPFNFIIPFLLPFLHYLFSALDSSLLFCFWLFNLFVNMFLPVYLLSHSQHAHTRWYLHECDAYPLLILEFVNKISSSNWWFLFISDLLIRADTESLLIKTLSDLVTHDLFNPFNATSLI